MTSEKLNRMVQIYGREIAEDIDFTLGSIEECNLEPVVKILEKYGIHPNGSWVNIDAVPDEAIKEMAETFY